MLWLALVVAALCGLSFVPLSVTFSVRRRRSGEPRISVGGKWGPLSLHVGRTPPPTGGRGERHGVTSHDERPHDERPARRSRKKAALRQLRAVLFSRDFLPSLGRLSARLLRSLRPRDLELYVKLGLGDPADTGRLWGRLSPLLALFWATGAHVVAEPDFTRVAFELEATGRVRVVPGWLLAVLLGYLLTPPPWRALVNYGRAA